MDDHITWLLEKKLYLEALNTAEATPSFNYPVSIVGEAFLQNLIAERKYHEAAQLCPRVMKKDKDLWEKWVFIFDEAKELTRLIPFIPYQSVVLSKTIYEMILANCIVNKINVMNP